MVAVVVFLWALSCVVGFFHFDSGFSLACGLGRPMPKFLAIVKILLAPAHFTTLCCKYV